MATQTVTRKDWLYAIGAATVTAAVGLTTTYVTILHDSKSRTSEDSTPTIKTNFGYDFRETLQLGDFSGGAPSGWDLVIPASRTYELLLCREADVFSRGDVDLEVEIRRGSVNWVYGLNGDNFCMEGIVLSEDGPVLEYIDFVDGMAHETFSTPIKSPIMPRHPYRVSLHLNDVSVLTFIEGLRYDRINTRLRGGGRFGFYSNREGEANIRSVSIRKQA